MSIVMTRKPRTDDELYAFVRAVLGYEFCREKVCAGHDAPFDAFAHAYFRRDPQILSLGSRGLSGKTRLMGVLGVTFALLDGAEASLLGGSLFQSNNLRDTINGIFDYPGFDRGWLAREPTSQLIEFTNGAKLRPLTASQKTVRGLHPPILLGDELDEMDPEIWESAKGQPMNQRNPISGELIKSMIVATSTRQKVDYTMEREMNRMREEGLPVFEWCYRESHDRGRGWLTQEQIDDKRRTVSAERWRVEYELGEPSIGNRAFDSAAVERMFSQSMPLDEEGEEDPDLAVKRFGKEWQEYEFAPYRNDREYVISADWAKEQDWTIITVFDCTHSPATVAYWVRMHHHPWPVMVGRYNQLMVRYNAYHGQAIHDGTGVGNMVNDYVDERAYGFLMTGQKRDEMLYNYIAAVESDKVRAPNIKEFKQAHLYASTDDMFSRGKEFHLPDEVCSMALGWHLIDRRAPANINIEIVGREHGATNAFEESINLNKPPHRSQAMELEKGKETEAVISFIA